MLSWKLSHRLKVVAGYRARYHSLGAPVFSVNVCTKGALNTQLAGFTFNPSLGHDLSKLFRCGIGSNAAFHPGTSHWQELEYKSSTTQNIKYMPYLDPKIEIMERSKKKGGNARRPLKSPKLLYPVNDVSSGPVGLWGGDARGTLDQGVTRFGELEIAFN